jgi:hypothetical protein
LTCAEIAPLFGVCARTVERASAKLTREGYRRPPRPVLPCGTNAAYARGCRCQACRDANTAEAHRFKAIRVARLEADPTLRPHGDLATYANWGCRCPACTAEASARWAAYRAEIKAWDQPCGFILTDHAHTLLTARSA